MKNMLITFFLYACVLALASEGLSQTAGPAAAPAKLKMVIWGGGKTAQEAQKMLAAYDSYKNTWKEDLVFASGYPRIIESAGVEGLNPGYHVVVLGVCNAEDAVKLTAAMRVVEPGVYTRDVVWPDGPACVRLGTNSFWPFPVSAKSKNGTLDGMLLYDMSRNYRVLVLGRDKNGVVTGRLQDDKICRAGTIMFADQGKLHFTGVCTVAVDPVPAEAEIACEYRLGKDGSVEKKVVSQKKVKN